MKTVLGLSLACLVTLFASGNLGAQHGHHSGNTSSQHTSSGSTGSSTRSNSVRKVQGSKSNQNQVNASWVGQKVKTSTIAKAGAKGQSQKGNMTQGQRHAIQSYIKEGNVSGPQQGALNRLQAGENLSFEDRSVLTNMLANDPKLDAETREAIQQGLRDDLENKRRTGSPQTERYLRIKNETTQPLNVFIQYRKPKGEDWVWFPADPKKSAQAITQVVPPGAETMAEVDQDPILTSRVRLWAKSATGGTQWLEYKDQDLWLVPEVDGTNSKDHVYYAPKAETFKFVFKS